MTDRVRRRHGGPYLMVAIDTLVHAVRRRSWLLLIVVICAAVAAAAAVIGQATLPYLIYPAL